MSDLVLASPASRRCSSSSTFDLCAGSDPPLSVLSGFPGAPFSTPPTPGAGRKRRGSVGSGGTSSGSSARTSRGVMSTISSVRSARSALLLNRFPMMGTWLSPGIPAASSCVRLLRRPAIANDWPSRSSTLVDAFRVESAGTRKPCSVIPLAKSRVLTSGATFSRMMSPAIVGVNVSLMPNSLYITVTALLAPEPWTIGDRNLAAGQEARFLVVVGNQVRLGKALEESLRLQRLDDRAPAFLSVEEEQVEEIAEDRLVLATLIVDGRRGELLRRRPDRDSPGRLTMKLAPSSVSARRLTSAKRTCSITCWLS